MRLFVKRIQRDEKAIEEIEKEVRVFLAEIDQRVRQLNAACLSG